MAPPIAGNGRAKSGRFPWPLLPSSPVVPSHLPAVVPSLPCRRPSSAAPAAALARRPAVPSPPPASQPPPLRRLALRFPRRPPELRSRRRPSLSFAPAASSRLSLLARAPPGRAVFSLGLAAASSPSVSPPFRGETTGDAPSPAKQWRCRHCTAFSRPGRRARASADVAVSSLGVATSPSTPACPRFRRNVAANLSVRLTGVVRPPVPPHPCTGQPHLHHLRHRSRDVVLGIASPSAEHRRGVFLAILASVQPLPAALVVSSPAPVVVVVILPSFPVVVAFVPPSSRSRPSSAFVQCAAAAPVVVFVLGSVSSSLVPAASRLRPRIAAEVVPSLSVSAAPVRRCRSLASSRGGL
uniref:Cell wall protein-like n=1 Tax=Oryza sativa subsp. japonica TaxID=39947 RepID=Q67U17_ORYSJ|nr:cell wall protein-like [Oryza sativa Japonica Group]